VFHQLIEKKKFDWWKKEWKAVIRDLKPFWVYQKSEQVLRKKGIFLDEYTERLAKIKNKNQSLFGNININDKFMTTTVVKDQREKELEKMLDDQFSNKVDTETENIGKQNCF
jgi:hypothetical protein